MSKSHAPRRKWRRRLERAAGAAVAGAALLALTLYTLHLAFPFPAERLVEAQSGGSAFIQDRDGGVIAWRVDATEAWRLPVRLEDISPWLIKATIAAEDKRFWRHCGVDPLALARAVRQNVTNFRRVSGASTITMQNIRLLWPRRRTYWAKCVEAFRAVQLEQNATKGDVIQLYVNLAPYGGNVIGVGAAARRYFGKRAAELSLAEAALLAGIPQRPARFNPRKHLDHALKRREFVLSRMRELGLASDDEVRAAERGHIEICPPQRRTEAPRFADYVLALRNGNGGAIRTTLDPRIQIVARGVVSEHAAKLRATGIDGVAAVVVGVGASDLLAMVGSADPTDRRTGSVNGAIARRQPGSLLKPFIYAAAFDSGLLTPQSVVYDVPSSWSGYRPRNMDRGYLGPVSAAEALAGSRNVPAVRLLGALGASRLATDIKRMGLNVRSAEERCGLSLALGTAEVRLIDIANAYATLARLGRWRRLRVFAEEDPGRAERVYSPGAAYLTLRSLGAADPGRRGRPVWKTGTSWNYRDAWAVTITPEHVAAVWCGKHSGRGHPGLIGAQAALPLAIEIAERISGRETGSWPRPPGVGVRRVCAVSGAPPTAACPHTVAAEYLPGVSGDAPCAIHRVTHRGGKRRAVTVWPPAVASYLASRGRANTAAARPSVRISSPVDGGEYILPSRADATSRVLGLAAEVPPGAGHVYWFLDGEFLKKAPAGEPVRWRMAPGRHELIASDDAGASARARFSVIRADAK